VDDAVGEGEERVVAAAADVAAWMDARAPLPHDDAARADVLPGVDFHAQILRVGIAAVAAGALALLVRHGCLSSNQKRSPRTAARGLTLLYPDVRPSPRADAAIISGPAAAVTWAPSSPAPFSNRHSPSRRDKSTLRWARTGCRAS